MLKLIGHHAPQLLAFLWGLNVHLTKPHLQQVLRRADAVIVSEARHKPIAGVSRLLVEAPAPANGADTLRLRPWPAEDLRAPLRHFIMAAVGAYAHQSHQWTLDVRLEDSWGAQDQGTRHLEAVAYHQDHTKSQGKQTPSDTPGTGPIAVRLPLGARADADEWRLSRREQTVRRLHRQRAPAQRLRCRQNTSVARARLVEFQPLVPAGCHVSVLFDRWSAAKSVLQCCRRQGWQGIWAIPSHRPLEDQQRSPWPPARRPQRYPRVELPATDGRQRSALVRSLQGRLTPRSFDVGVLISNRPQRDKRPKYFLCTDVSVSAQKILPLYQKRWPMEGDTFYVKQHLGLVDLRVQTCAAREKWCAMVCLALAFLPWRWNHASAEERVSSLADVARQHRYEHAGTLLETACQEAAKEPDDRAVYRRFLCQPT